MNEDSKPGKPVSSRGAGIDTDESQSRAADVEMRRRDRDMPRPATHRGNFKAEFGIDVDCYVLDDEHKTAVISKRGMGAAIGLNGSGLQLERFLRGGKVGPHLGPELAEKLANPLIFKLPSLVSKQPPVEIHGYDVTILIDVCRAVVAANHARPLMQRQQGVVRQASMILGASANLGIKQLVYALAGYRPAPNEVIAEFKRFVREQAREYEREFPEELYVEWYRLYDLLKPARNRPWKFRALTLSHVYKPLARSRGVVLDLVRKGRAAGASMRKKLHQFLSEVGVKALRRHLGQLLGIAQISTTRAEYERNVNKVFGTQLLLL